MTRRRWIADEVFGSRAALVGTHADHLIRVLRARVGQQFEIAAGEEIYRGRVTSIEDQRVEFELGERLPVVATPQITLLIAIFKFDRLEWAVEKCTELGVHRFIPVLASRTDAHLGSAAGKRIERWRRIAREAAEQSRRGPPPRIVEAIKLKEAIELPGSLRIVLSESEKTSQFASIFKTHETRADLMLAVGPEGGWTQKEEDLFRASGWIPASLGPTILRSETAAIAASAIALSQLAGNWQ